MDPAKRVGVNRAIKSTAKSSKDADVAKRAESRSGDDWSRQPAAKSVATSSHGTQREALPASDRSCSPSSSVDEAPSEMHGGRRRTRVGPADIYDSASASESSDAALAAAGAASAASAGGESTASMSVDAAAATRRLMRGARLSKESKTDFLGNFDPDCSSREMRKVHRRIAEERLSNASKNQTLYDGQGCFLEDGSDICDCLEDGCPGCFKPCLKCGLTKCGMACRSNRRWMVETVEVDGVNIVRHHPRKLYF